MQAFFGAAAVVLTSLGWVPQVKRALASRSAKDFSWGWIGLFGTGLCSWLVYGALAHDAAILTANAIAVTAVAIIAYLRLRHGG